MSRRKIESHLDCIAYLSETEGTLTQIERKESKQEKVIREYANRHNIKVVKTVRRNGFSMNDVYRQFEIMANMIRKHQIDGVIVTRTWVLPRDDELIYSLIGKIKNAGGSFVTTTEGRLGLELEVKPNAKK